MELNENELEKVIGGNTKGIGEQMANENPDLFRKKQLEELKNWLENEKDKELNKSELTEEELSEIKAGMPRK